MIYMCLRRRCFNFDSWQEQSCEELKAFLDKFGTLRTVESGEGTPDALFGKINSVVLAMIQQVREAMIYYPGVVVVDSSRHGPNAGRGTTD